MKKETLCIAGAVTTAVGTAGVLLKDNKYIANYKKIVSFVSGILALFGAVITLASLDSILKPIEEEENEEDGELIQ